MTNHLSDDLNLLLDDGFDQDHQMIDEQMSVYQSYCVQPQDIGERIDKVAAQAFADFSREQLKQWLMSGELTVNQTSQKPKYRLKANDVLLLNAQLIAHPVEQAENIPLNIVYEDEDVLVINKPVGLVVHAGAGNWSGTLVNGLLYHYPEQRILPRAGLVHRIDKDTTGLLIIAKNSYSQLHLINQLKNKSVYRHYQALILANPHEIHQLTIQEPIGRHPQQRTKMAVISSGKSAITHIKHITPIVDGLSLVDVQLETGRTHQIRVHLSHIHCPLLADPVYGSSTKFHKFLKQCTNEQQMVCQQLNRQALHAYELGFIHPKTEQKIQLQAPLPEDMQKIINIFH